MIAENRIEEDPFTASGGTMQVDDLFAPNVLTFTPKTYRALSHKTQNLLYQWNEPTSPLIPLVEFLAKLKLKTAKAALEQGQFQYVRRAAPVEFYGCTVSENNLQAATEMMVNFLNDVGDRGYILATLFPLGKLALATRPGAPKQYALFSYFVVDPKGKTYVDTTHKRFSFQEGATPPVFEDIK